MHLSIIQVDVNQCIMTVISSGGKAVIISFIIDGIILAHIVSFHLYFGRCGCAHIRLQIMLFFFKNSAGTSLVLACTLPLAVLSSHSLASLLRESISVKVLPRRKLYLIYFTTFSIFPLLSGSLLRQKTASNPISFTN